MIRTCFRVALLAVMALLFSPGVARAADETPLSDPVVGKLHDKMTRFLEGVAAGDESTSFTSLLSGSPLSDQAGAVRALVDKSKEIGERYGMFRESEQLSAKRIGKDLVLMKYLYKCEKFPVVWYVVYYRDFSRSTTAGDDQWVVISLRFDTQIEALAN